MAASVAGGIVACLLALTLAAGGAGAVEIEIESPEVEIDREAGVYRYDGARVRLRELVVEADRVTIASETGRLTAEGRVRFRDGPMTGSAARLVLDTAEGTGTAYDAAVHDRASGYYLRAERLVRTAPGTYQAHDCSLTNCPPASDAWRLDAHTLTYRRDSHAVAESTTLRLGGVPALWSPAFAWPTVQERRSGVLAPEISQQTSSEDRFDVGTGIGVPVFLALGIDHDLTLTPTYLGRRGPALDLDYRYAFHGDQRGAVDAWSIQETVRRDLDEENRILSPQQTARQDRTPRRYWLRWRHNEGLGQRGRLTARLARGSDGQVWREYESLRNYRPSLDYQATLSRQQGWGDTAATAEHASEYVHESLFADSDRFTDGDVRPLLLPKLAYRGGWQPGGAAAPGLELSGFATRFYARDGASGSAAMAEPAATWPLRLGGSLELRPTVSRRLVRYTGLAVAPEALATPAAERPLWLEDAEALGREEGYGQTTVDVELLAPFARTYGGEGNGNGEALKHRLTPRLRYRDIEDVEQPLAGMLLRPVPALRLVTLEADNAWLTGRPGEAAAQVARARLSQRYNLLLEDESFRPEGPPLPTPGETEPGQPLMPLILDAGVSAAGFSTDLFLRYHHQRARVVEYRLGLSGSVSPRAGLRVSYVDNDFTYRTPDNKLHTETNALGLAGTVRQTDRFSYGFDGQVNLREQAVPLDRRLTRAAVFVDYHPPCYAINVTYLEQVDVTREFNRATGANEDVFFVDRRILLTFTVGGVVRTTRGFTLPTGE